MILSLLLSLLLTSVYIVLSVMLPSHHFHNAMYVSALLKLRYFQYSCFATGEDGLISVSQNTLHLTSATTMSQISFPNDFSLSSNRSWLGFKPNLNSKYAGSLLFQHAFDSRRLVFPIGASFLRYRPL